MPERILILQLKRIGDAILTAPAFALLRESFPDAHLTLVLSPAAAQLGEAFCDIDELLCYRLGRPNFHLWARLIRGGFDSCLDFSGNDRSALMTRLSGAPVRLGYQKFAVSRRWRRAAFTVFCNASVRDLHTVDFHLALVRMKAGASPPPLPSHSGFAVPAHVLATSQTIQTRVGERYALVHPGTARQEKYWPPERWAQVIDHLRSEHGIACLLTGSVDDPDEVAHLREIEQHSATSPLNLAGQLSLLEVAAAISGCTIALGVDSAAMHLAAMLSRPQIVLFGPTNPYHWRPRHGNAAVLLAGNDSLNVDTFKPKHQPSPMAKLPTHQVCSAIDAVLAWPSAG